MITIEKETFNSSGKKREEFALRQARIVEEVSYLMLTERIIAGIERVQLHLVGDEFDLEPFKTAVRELKKHLAAENFEAAANTEFNILQELQYRRMSLAERDLRIGTFDVRQFFERTGNVLDSQVLAVLARFYRNLPATNVVRSKFDYVITKMFSREEPGGKRSLRVAADSLAEHLTELASDWSEVSPLRCRRNEQKIAATVKIFEAFIAEAREKQTIEEFARLEIFSRIRKFKMRLGEIFYVPEVTAASILCNIEIGNKFTDLISKESENIKDSANFRIGLVESLQDFAGDQSSRVKQILRHVAEEEISNPKTSETEQKGFKLVEISAPSYPPHSRKGKNEKNSTRIIAEPSPTKSSELKSSGKAIPSAFSGTKDRDIVSYLKTFNVNEEPAVPVFSEASNENNNFAEPAEIAETEPDFSIGVFSALNEFVQIEEPDFADSDSFDTEKELPNVDVLFKQTFPHDASDFLKKEKPLETKEFSAFLANEENDTPETDAVGFSFSHHNTEITLSSV